MKKIRYYACGKEFRTKFFFIRYCIKHNLIGKHLYSTIGWQLNRVMVVETDYGYIIYEMEEV